MINSGFKVIYYHTVGKRSDYLDFFFPEVPIHSFINHINKLIKKKYYFVSFEELYEEYQKKNDISKFVVLTFDDGYFSNFQNVKSFLKQKKIPATFFLTGTTITNNPMWRDKLSFSLNYIKKNNPQDLFSFQQEVKKSLDWKYHEFLTKTDDLLKVFNIPDPSKLFSKERLYMNEEDIHELLKDGHSLGLHSMYHPYFKNTNDIEAVSDIIQNNDLIKKLFNYEPISFSFPFGARFPKKLFYEKLIEKTNLKFFCGINANCFSNTLKSDLKYTERLGMEDPRNFFLNWQIRPIFRSLKNETKKIFGSNSYKK